MHWAFDLIGRPWAPNERGPRAFSCWGLLWHAFHSQKGIDLPWVPEKPDRDAAMLRDAAHASGWRPADYPMREWDVLALRSADGRRHVALVVAANGALHVLHCDGYTIGTKNYGTVKLERFDDIKSYYKEIELWRQAT